MIKKIYYVILFVLGGITGGVFYYLVALLTDESFQESGKLLTNNTEYSMMILSVFSFGLIFYFAAPVLQRKGLKTTVSIGKDLENIPGRIIMAGTFGVIGGLIIALLISMTYRSLLPSGWYSLLTIALYVVCGYFGFAIAVSKSRDAMTPNSRQLFGVLGLFDTLRGKPHQSNAPKVIDTSVVIDGRIADIMKAGFIEGPLIVPEFVLSELRHIADSSDPLRRARGRRGLDVLDEMQRIQEIEIMNTSKLKNIEEIPEVDVKLIKLTQALNGKLLTTDYNLNKVAVINDIPVLNINDLANAIKPVVIPGEKMIVRVVKQGKDQMQGIGYLDDGTMIVVENGRDRIGEEATITVTSVIQTSAGKMIFGRCQLRPDDKIQDA